MEEKRLIAGKFYLDTEDGKVFLATEKTEDGERFVENCDGTSGWAIDNSSYYQLISD